MSDLLTEGILPVLGLCPPASLLLPWLSQARAPGGRPLGLPLTGCAATFAVAKRVAERRKSGTMDAPVAALLLEPEQEGPAALAMLDWLHELGPHSAAALRGADPKIIFGTDVPVGRRCLVVLTEDDALPHAAMASLSRRLQMPQPDLGWLGLRQLYDVLGEHIRRVPRDRWRAPERTASELLGRLADEHGIRPWHPLMPVPPSLVAAGLPGPVRRYEPRRPGSIAFPWSFQASESVYNAALVLEAQLGVRRQARFAPLGSKR